MAKQKLPKRITPAGIASYPWLGKPDTKFNAAGEYKVTLILTDEAFNEPNEKWDGMSMKEMLDATAGAKYDETVEALLPAEAKRLEKGTLDIKRAHPYEEEINDEGEETGNWKVSFKMKAKVTPKDGKAFTQKPIIVDAKRKEMKEAIYGGSTIKVSFQSVPYLMKNDKTTWTAGVSLRLIAVQVLELVQGSRDTGFDDEEGYESTGSEANDFADESDADDDEQEDDF